MAEPPQDPRLAPDTGGETRTQWKVRYRQMGRLVRPGSSVVPIFTVESSPESSREAALFAAGVRNDGLSESRRTDISDRQVFHRDVTDWPDGAEFIGPWVEEVADDAD